MWFFGRRAAEKTVEPGMVFFREYGNHFREYAEVVSTDSRLFGMPHVKFVKTYRNGDWQESGGTFVLALQAFLESYEKTDAPEDPEQKPQAVVLDFQSARETWKAKQDRLRSCAPVAGANAR